MVSAPGVWLIAGPTASGKSALAARLARQIGGEVINADASQLYADLAILTARPSAAELALAPHRLYGIADGADAWSVGRWLRAVLPILEDLGRQGRAAIVTGGTGLYFRALTHGLAEAPEVPDTVRAAEILRKEGVDCNMTLIFSLAQAMICADAGAFLISPFVGRILDWNVKNTGKTYTAESDPGVLSVRAIHAYYKTHGVKTVVMGASFRNTGEIEALAGCDRLTIAPALLDALSKDKGDLPRALDPARPNAAPPRRTLDEKAFRYELNADAMATEKLAEGIRLFAKDLAELRDLVGRRLA